MTSEPARLLLAIDLCRSPGVLARAEDALVREDQQAIATMETQVAR